MAENITVDTLNHIVSGMNVGLVTAESYLPEGAVEHEERIKIVKKQFCPNTGKELSDAVYDISRFDFNNMQKECRNKISELKKQIAWFDQADGNIEAIKSSVK